MRPGHWGVDSLPYEKMVWRLSGFSNCRLIAHDFAGPSSGTSSFPYYETCKVGRDPEQCQFIIPGNEGTVSRVHAELKFFPGRGLGLRDLKAVNGTFLNDERIGSDDYKMLNAGDRVRLGNLLLDVSYPR